MFVICLLLFRRRIVADPNGTIAEREHLASQSKSDSKRLIGMFCQFVLLFGNLNASRHSPLALIA